MMRKFIFLLMLFVSIVVVSSDANEPEEELHMKSSFKRYLRD